MFKIVEDDGGKFRIKEVDANGNSIQLLEESFDSHNAATKHITDVLESTEGGQAIPKEVNIAGETVLPEGEESAPVETVTDTDTVQTTENMSVSKEDAVDLSTVKAPEDTQPAA